MSQVIVCLPFGRSFPAILEDVRKYVTDQGDGVFAVYAILSPQDNEADVPADVKPVRTAYRPQDGDDVLYVVNGGTTAAQWEIARLWAWYSRLANDSCWNCQRPSPAPRVTRIRVVNLQRDGATVLENYS